MIIPRFFLTLRRYENKWDFMINTDAADIKRAHVLLYVSRKWMLEEFLCIKTANQ